MHMTYALCELTIITGHAWVKWAHSQVKEEIETKEAQNIGLKSGQEKSYRLCGELFSTCAEYYGITVNGEIEGNNLMVCKSLILSVSAMLAGEKLSVAYSKSLVQIYSYHGGDDIRNHLEIEAHAGSVNDLAFAYPNKILSIVTCGDDKLIKVWDAVTGAIQNEFEGHEAPVYSVCPHFKENIQTSPFVRFNKDGMLLAVLIHANGIKILANPDGVGLLRTTENSSFDPSGVASTPVAKNNEKRNLVDRPRIRDEAIDKSRMWKVTEISEPSQCLSLRFPDNTSSLMQSQSGNVGEEIVKSRVNNDAMNQT
ncbi:topless-related protein 4-like protein isoform X1 [Tanacetum coccineum]